MTYDLPRPATVGRFLRNSEHCGDEHQDDEVDHGTLDFEYRDILDDSDGDASGEGQRRRPVHRSAWPARCLVESSGNVPVQLQQQTPVTPASVAPIIQ